MRHEKDSREDEYNSYRDGRNNIQSNMEDWVYQIQRMLADKLDGYRERGNQYVDDNIQEIQELYKEEE